MTLSQTWYATYSAKQFFYYTSHYTNTDKSVRFWTECIVYASFILDYSGIEKRERERKWMDISAAIRSLTTTRIRIRALYSCQLNRLKCNSFFSDVSNKERAIYFYLRPLFWILMQSSAVNYSLNFSNNFREERNSAWCQRCFSIWPIDGDNGSIWCWQEYTLEYSRRICVSVTKSSPAELCELKMMEISVKLALPGKSPWTERVDQATRLVSAMFLPTFTRMMRYDHTWRCEKWWPLPHIWNSDLTLPKHIKWKWYVLESAATAVLHISANLLFNLMIADWKYVDIARFGKTYWRKYRIAVGRSEKTSSNCIGIDQQSTGYILRRANHVSLEPMTSIAVAHQVCWIRLRAMVETCFQCEFFYSDRIKKNSVRH